MWPVAQLQPVEVLGVLFGLLDFDRASAERLAIVQVFKQLHGRMSIVKWEAVGTFTITPIRAWGLLHDLLS